MPTPSGVRASFVRDGLGHCRWVRSGYTRLVSTMDGERSKGMKTRRLLLPRMIAWCTDPSDTSRGSIHESVGDRDGEAQGRHR